MSDLTTFVKTCSTIEPDETPWEQRHDSGVWDLAGGCTVAEALDSLREAGAKIHDYWIRNSYKSGGEWHDCEPYLVVSVEMP